MPIIKYFIISLIISAQQILILTKQFSYDYFIFSSDEIHIENIPNDLTTQGRHFCLQ